MFMLPGPPQLTKKTPCILCECPGIVQSKLQSCITENAWATHRDRVRANGHDRDRGCVHDHVHRADKCACELTQKRRAQQQCLPNDRDGDGLLQTCRPGSQLVQPY